MSLRFRIEHDRCGMTLVEVMIAATILIVVVWGTVAFLVSARTIQEQAGQRRAATQVAVERLELSRSAGYAGVANGSGSVSINGINYTWTLAVSSATADPGDGNSLYKILLVTVNWATSGNQPVKVSAAIAPSS